MARIITIDFKFLQKQYTALVTIGTALDGKARYTVAPNDENLQQLLPGGRISFSSLSDLNPIAEKQPQLHELALSMALALYQRVETATS